MIIEKIDYPIINGLTLRERVEQEIAKFDARIGTGKLLLDILAKLDDLAEQVEETGQL